MTEKRFSVMKKFDGSYVICDKGKMLVADDCCDLLNEQRDIIKSKDSLLSILAKENEQLKCINDQLEERLENSGIGVALIMECDYRLNKKINHRNNICTGIVISLHNNRLRR